MNDLEIKQSWLAEVKGQPYSLRQPKPLSPPNLNHTSTKSKIIKRKILANVEKWETMTAREIAKELGVTKNCVFSNFYKMGLKFKKLYNSKGATIRECKRVKKAFYITQ